MANNMISLMQNKLHKLLQTKLGKLLFILSFVFIVFVITSWLNRIANTHHTWEFDCHADAYLNRGGNVSSYVGRSDLDLVLTMEHNKVRLAYSSEYQQYNQHRQEYAWFQGDLERVDMGSLTYHLELTLQQMKWLPDSRLRPYLLNELTLVDSGLVVDHVFTQQIQVLDIDSKYHVAIIKFIPSNSFWVCQLSPSN